MHHEMLIETSVEMCICLTSNVLGDSKALLIATGSRPGLDPFGPYNIDYQVLHLALQPCHQWIRHAYTILRDVDACVIMHVHAMPR